MKKQITLVLAVWSSAALSCDSLEKEAREAAGYEKTNLEFRLKGWRDVVEGHRGSLAKEQAKPSPDVEVIKDLRKRIEYAEKRVRAVDGQLGLWDPEEEATRDTAERLAAQSAFFIDKH